MTNRLTQAPTWHFGPPAAARDAAAPERHTLHVRMLAGFELWQDGVPVTTLPHGRSRSLLKLLLLRRRHPLGRTHLCKLYFPDHDLACARNNLHATVYRLRRALDGVLVVCHVGDGYQILSTDPIWLDTEQFVLHAELGVAADAQGQPEQALSHYELAADLYRSDLADAAGPEQALAGDCQDLRDRLNQVLERLALLRELAGDLHGCLRAGQRHLGLDECNEAAHRQLMRCYAGLGQLQQAEKQYRCCIGVLRAQLGLSPTEETTALYRRLVTRQPG